MWPAKSPIKSAWLGLKDKKDILSDKTKRFSVITFKRGGLYQRLPHFYAPPSFLT